MRSSIFLYLAQKRVFWTLRVQLNKLFFLLGRSLFGFRYKVKEENTNFQSLRELISITQFQLFSALIVSISLLLIDGYLFRLYPTLVFKIPNDSDYVTLFATISGIGGVFIGLYYAGVSTVGSAIYSRVPNNIRDLLARDRIGNVYMRYLSFITFISLCFIALRVLGYPRIHLAVIVGLVGSGIGIIAFVKLGQRAFYLFDPTALSYDIFEELNQLMNTVCAGGYRWNDPSFQQHAFRRASTALETLSTLADMTAEQPHLSGKPFADLNKNICGFLINYERSKHRIPSESRWYEQRYKHKDWYRAEETAVSIAHHTGTALQPEVTRDKAWVETRLLPIVTRCITINLKANHYSIVIELMGYLDAYLKVVSANGGLKDASRILKDVGDSVLKEIGQSSQDVALENEKIEKLGFAEFIAYMPISMLIAYIESIENLTKEQISEKLRRITWKHGIDMYRKDFHAYCLPRLEWFTSRLNYEADVEGLIVTPLWYQSELVCQVEAEQLNVNSREIVSNITSLYQSWINQLDTSKHPWLSSALISREWEYLNKAMIHLRVIKQKWDDISGNRRVKGLPWADLKMEDIENGLKERKSDVLKIMPQRSIILAMISRPEGFPDYSGQFLHTAGEAIFDAMYRGDIEIFKAICRSYFLGCLLKFDKLRPAGGATDWRAQQEVKIAAAPLLDLMDLCGYARIFADYHDKPEFWSEVISFWDDYLNQERQVSLVSILAAAVSITEANFEIPYRSVLRTTWHQGVSHRLKDIPTKRVYHRGRPIGISEVIVQHESPLVRIFAGDPYGSFHDGIDIFITQYLQVRPDARDIDFGHKRRSLLEELEYESERYSQAREIDEDQGE